jgi:D-aminopeptidase
MERRDRIMLAMKHLSTTVLLCALCAAGMAAQNARPRARDLGLRPGVLTPGPLNAITDVAGVRVGHTTLVSGDSIRTGVTAVVPHDGNVFQQKVPGAVFVGNAFGKLAGSTQVEELGTIETPIVLTNTLSVGAAIEGVVRWTLQQSGNEQVRSVNALVGETNDGGLNDIRALHVRPEHVVAAITAARTGAVEEGSVGAGTGTRAFSWKGGIGTASRRLDARAGGYTVGVLVQSNYGGYLTMGGAPVGRELASARARQGNEHDGSCMIVVATDAPLDARDLKRLAARAIYGLARTGSSYSNGSGDFAIAFSTVRDLRVQFGETNAQARTLLPTDGVSNVFLGALEATEEAVYNSLLKATTVTSRSGSAEAIPVDRLTEVLRRYRAIE